MRSAWSAHYTRKKTERASEIKEPTSSEDTQHEPQAGGMPRWALLSSRSTQPPRTVFAKIPQSSLRVPYCLVYHERGNFQRIRRSISSFDEKRKALSKSFAYVFCEKQHGTNQKQNWNQPTKKPMERTAFGVLGRSRRVPGTPPVSEEKRERAAWKPNPNKAIWTITPVPGRWGPEPRCVVWSLRLSQKPGNPVLLRKFPVAIVLRNQIALTKSILYSFG